MQITQFHSLKQLWLRVCLTFVSQFGSNVFAFGMALYIYAKTASAISFGINLIVVPLVTVILSPIVGRVIDTYSHKKIVIISQIASLLAVFCFILAGQVVTGQLLIPVSFLLIACLKIADEFILLTLYASSVNFVLEEHQQKMRAYQQIAANISRILAPIFGGFLYALISFSNFVWVEFASEFLSLLLILALNFKLVQHDTQLSSESVTEDTSFKSSLKWLKTQPYLKAVIGFSCVVNAVDTVIAIALPITVLTILRLSNQYYAFLMSMMIVGELLSSLIIAKRKPRAKPLKFLIPLNVISTLFLLMIGLVPALGYSKPVIIYSFLVITVFAIPFIETFYNIPLQVWYVTEIPERIQGRIFSLSGALISGIMPIGTLFFSLGYELKFANLLIINLILIGLAFSIKMVLFAYFKWVKKIDFAEAKILK
ncbi:MFS transporter [Bacilli bacterium]|nr:MFS transporter [Bacilli bacterium]GHU41988.1 MFS transporter [Bacilli bacterium]